jgi:hypothetical protein
MDRRHRLVYVVAAVLVLGLGWFAWQTIRSEISRD